MFDVWASGYYLLQNFSVQNTSKFPVIKEFYLNIKVEKFGINFAPSFNSSFAFVNAMELFLAPETFIPDSARRFNSSATTSNYSGLSSQVLKTIHRINMGGDTITPENDTLWRTWVPDDDYLNLAYTARRSTFYSNALNYVRGGATNYSAPDFVYQTAKELNTEYDNVTSNGFNITWSFPVSKNTLHFLRVHFSDIVSQSPNVIKFNLFINTKNVTVDPFQIIVILAAPFYMDFVVDSDASGNMSIGIGPHNESVNHNAFLNGLEIMEFMKIPRLDSAPSKLPGHKNTVLIIIGSVCGGILLMSIFLASFFLMKLWKSKPSQILEWPLVSLYGGGSSHNRETNENASPVPYLKLGLRIPFADILYATKNFDVTLKIGEGGFGKVYEGTLWGMKVAVKRSDPNHGQGIMEFQTEIMVLSKIRHRHLVSLIGYCDEWSEMILVYEFMEKGTLREHLYESNKAPKLSWKRRLQICTDAAKGLDYLHSGLVGGIVHRDVKSTNILLDENFVAKVADFGLSKSRVPDLENTSMGVKGSFGYLDPEYFRTLQWTDKSDVYSFGVVLLEVICARPAIDTSLPREQVSLADWGISMQKKGRLQEIIDPFLFREINLNSLRKFGEIAEICLRECGIERPSMKKVLWDLEYALGLQETPIVREPYEDSMPDASMGLPMLLPILQRFPSSGFIDDNDKTLLGVNNGSDTTVSEVFSQLRISEAR